MIKPGFRRGACVLVSAVLLAAPGCWTARHQADVGAERVRVGMSEKEVREAVGPPSLTETAGGGQEIWTYHYSNDRFKDLGALGERAEFRVVLDRKARTVIRVARVDP
jgi:outer membrane protein assembly factor BamE (lipoprotein component of BamABCDE complex)